MILMVVYLSLETGILARSLFGIWSEGTLDIFELLAFRTWRSGQGDSTAIAQEHCDVRG